MSARREHRLRKLERRIERLEGMAHPPTEDCHFGIATAPGALDADYQVLHAAGKRSLFQRIKDFFA